MAGQQQQQSADDQTDDKVEDQTDDKVDDATDDQTDDDDTSDDDDKSDDQSDDDDSDDKSDDDDKQDDTSEDDVVPESADGYKLELPDLKLEGVDPESLKFADDDPIAKAFREGAHERGLKQSDVNWLMEMYGQVMSTSFAQTKETLQNQRDAALKDLGGGDADKGRDYAVRVLSAGLELLGDKAKEHETGLLAALTQPAGVRALEALFDEVNSDGTGPRPNNRGDNKRDNSRLGRAKRLFNKSVGS